MNRQSKVVIDILSRPQLNFIKSELGFDAETILAMDDDALLEMYDRICDIEIEETNASDNRNGGYSDRELMAEGIVTRIGNALYRPEEEGED